MKKYPRYFVNLRNWYPNDLYYLVNIQGKVYSITKNSEKLATDWVESDCETNIERGYWREIPIEEAVLIS